MTTIKDLQARKKSLEDAQLRRAFELIDPFMAKFEAALENLTDDEVLRGVFSVPVTYNEFRVIVENVHIRQEVNAMLNKRGFAMTTNQHVLGECVIIMFCEAPPAPKSFFQKVLDFFKSNP